MFLNKDFSRIYLTIPALPQSGSHFPQLVLVTLSMVVVVAAAVIEECIFTASVSCDRLREEICLEQIEIFHAGADKGSSPHSHDHWHNLNKLLQIHTILALRHCSTLHSTRHSSSSSAPTQNSAKRSTLGFAYRFLYSCSAFRTFRKVHLSRLDDSIDHYRITWSYGSRNPWSEFASGLLNIILLLILLLKIPHFSFCHCFVDITI